MTNAKKLKQQALLKLKNDHDYIVKLNLNLPSQSMKIVV